MPNSACFNFLTLSSAYRVSGLKPQACASTFGSHMVAVVDQICAMDNRGHTVVLYNHTWDAIIGVALVDSIGQCSMGLDNRGDFDHARDASTRLALQLPWGPPTQAKDAHAWFCRPPARPCPWPMVH